MKTIIYRAVFATATALLLSGCISAGGDNTDPETDNSTSLSGTVAIGAPISNARITIRDINGQTANTEANSNGRYQADVSSLTFPLTVRATDPNSPLTLFSFADEGVSVANATPITSVLLSESLPSGYSLESFFQTANASTASQVRNSIQQRVQALRTLAENAGLDYSDFDHFGGEFDANHTGYDAFLDDLDIRVDDDSVAIVLDGELALATVDVDEMLGNNGGLTATVSGSIVNAATNAPVNSANIQATNVRTNTTVLGSYDSGTGVFSITLDRFAVYDLEISATGFQTVNYSNLSTFSALTTVPVNLIPVIGEDEVNAITQFTASVIDATTTSTAVEGATITVREGLNTRYGTAEYSATTNVDGEITLNDVTPGVYTFEVSADGYYTAYRNVAVLSTNTSVELSLRPELNTGDLDNAADMTIVLTWDQNPSDLDSHLTGPKVNAANDDDRFHVAFYYDCWADTELNSEASCTGSWDAETSTYVYSDATAYLDRDDTTSFGPETITLFDMIEGEYNYYVHHYSGTGSITTTSAAQVVVIDKFGQQHTFNPPATGGNGDEDIWHVFKTSSTGTIIPVNEILTNTNTSSLRSLSGNPENIRKMIENLPSK